LAISIPPGKKFAKKRPGYVFLGSFSFFIKQLKIYTADSNGTQNTPTTCFPRFGENNVENIPHFFIKYTINKKHAVLKKHSIQKALPPVRGQGSSYILKPG